MQLLIHRVFLVQHLVLQVDVGLVAVSLPEETEGQTLAPQVGFTLQEGEDGVVERGDEFVFEVGVDLEETLECIATDVRVGVVEVLSHTGDQTLDYAAVGNTGQESHCPASDELVGMEHVGP